MVQATINISEKSNKILNLVKSKYGLKNKSQAIEKIIESYGEDILEPELRPEFIERMKEIEHEPTIRVDNFAKRYGLE
ncbi:MAG: DUF2683 family protein [Methanosarcinales archaeon]